MAKITLKDHANMSDKSSTIKEQITHRMNAGPTKTKIIITDHNTGEVLGEISNKILVPGSQITACKQFGLDQIINFPTYNQSDQLDLDKSVDPWSEEPLNPQITCLWCAGRDGAATSPNEVYVVNNTDRIEPVNDILPFVYVDINEDLGVDGRDIYFGKRTNSVTGKISYYFKKFDTTPQLHINYIDGTEVTEDMYTVVTDQSVEIYVEMRLSVTRNDFRDYFNEVIGWDNADISTISLVSAWYTEEEDTLPDGTTGIFKYYQDIIPFSKFNFKAEELVDLTRAIDFTYQVFY